MSLGNFNLKRAAGMNALNYLPKDYPCKGEIELVYGSNGTPNTLHLDSKKLVFTEKKGSIIISKQSPFFRDNPKIVTKILDEVYWI